MQWSDLPRTATPRTLRQFAGLSLAFFGGLAAWNGLVRGRPGLAALFAVLAATIGGIGLIRPRAVRPIFLGWMAAAFPIGWTVSNLLMAALYYAVITPLGLALRLAGRDPLRLRPQPAPIPTYWTSRPATDDPRRYLRPF